MCVVFGLRPENKSKHSPPAGHGFNGGNYTRGRDMV
jgi:hypothetical protein